MKFDPTRFHAASATASFSTSTPAFTPAPAPDETAFEPPVAPMAMPRQRLERRRSVVRLHLAWLRRTQRHG